MPDLESIRLYLFEGLPVYTDVKREADLLQTNAWMHMRIARRRWRATHCSRDPRYLVYVDGYAFASESMQCCPYCGNERPRVCDALVCFCTMHV